MRSKQELLLMLSGGGFYPQNNISGANFFDVRRGLYQDSAMTTAVSSGDPTGGWFNQAGSNHASAAGNVRPIWNANAFGTGLPGLVFDGSNDGMDANGLASLFSGTDQPFSIVMAAKLAATSTIYTMIGLGSVSAANMEFDAFGATRKDIIRRDDTPATLQQQITSANDTNTKVWTWVYNGTQISLRVNGAVIMNALALNSVNTVTFTKFGIGFYPPTLPAVNPSKWWNGLIGDITIVNRAITANEINLLESFTAVRCGVSYPFELASIASPVENQAFQANDGTGDISISGVVYPTGAHDVEARFNGGAWQVIDSAATASYSGTLSNQAIGQGTLEVRLADESDKLSRQSYISIGDGFAGWGQSNNSGRGTENQSYSGAYRPILFGNDYRWKALTDPWDSASSQTVTGDSVSVDNDAAGSFIPPLASLLVENQNIPVFFIPCAKGGSSITQWLPAENHTDTTTLYGSGVYRIQQNPVKVVLWWQGEQDALAGMSQATYNGHLDTIANALFVDCGIKLMACKIQNCTGISAPNQAAINAAIEEAWGDNDNVLQGPDLSDIVTDDTFHLMSSGKLQLAAQRWYEAIETFFYGA